MTLRHSLMAGLAIGLGFAAATGLPAFAQESYTLSDELTKALDGVVEAIKAEEGTDPDEVLFAATRYLDASLFPERWADVDLQTNGPPLAIVKIFPGDNIIEDHIVLPGKNTYLGDPKKGTIYEGWVKFELGTGSDCVWRTLSTGDRVKICR